MTNGVFALKETNDGTNFLTSESRKPSAAKFTHVGFTDTRKIAFLKPGSAFRSALVVSGFKKSVIDIFYLTSHTSELLKILFHFLTLFTLLVF